MAEILVTGGAGFIGSHLVDALIAQGHSVSVMDNLSTGKRSNIHPAARFIAGDIRNSLAVRHAVNGVDAVFHLAAVASVQKSNEEWSTTHLTNSAGTVNVMDAARTAKDGAPVPVVYASSAAVYGRSSDNPLRESDETRPLTAYGADKLSNEFHARAAGIVHELPTCGLRFFNVYGPRQDPSSPYSGVISIFADRIAAGQDLNLFGDGNQTRDFIHVSDIVAHLLAAWRNASADAPVFNACTGRAISLNDLIDTLARCSGRTPVVHSLPARQGDIRHSVGNPTAAIEKLGVSAKTEIFEGLEDLVGQPAMLLSA